MFVTGTAENEKPANITGIKKGANKKTVKRFDKDVLLSNYSYFAS